MISPIYEPSSKNGPLRQGEIISNLFSSYITEASIKAPLGRIPYFGVTQHPLAIVVSQECDLDLEFKARHGIPFESGKIPPKSLQIPNILFCAVFKEDEIHGNPDIKSSLFKSIKDDTAERYQYLRTVSKDEDAEGLGLPGMIIDFRYYFTVPVDDVYARLSPDVARKAWSSQRRCRLISPYLEHFTTQFAGYLSRVALPEKHYREKPTPHP